MFNNMDILQNTHPIKVKFIAYETKLKMCFTEGEIKLKEYQKKEIWISEVEARRSHDVLKQLSFLGS